MSVLLDSNVVIYAGKPAYGRVREFVAAHRVAVSLISHVEVLGYQGMSDVEERALRAVLDSASTLSVSDAVVAGAIMLRRQRRIGLGDSIVAATALQYGLTLATRNTGDFSWIAGLNVINPID